jgi:hypothetical protein
VRRLAQQQAGDRVRWWGKAASTCGAVLASVREKEIRMEEKGWVPWDTRQSHRAEEQSAVPPGKPQCFPFTSKRARAMRVSNNTDYNKILCLF